MKGITVYLTTDQDFRQNAKKEHEIKNYHRLNDPVRKVLDKSSETSISTDLSFDPSSMPVKKETPITLKGNAPKNLNFVLLMKDDKRKPETTTGPQEGNGIMRDIKPDKNQKLKNSLPQKVDKTRKPPKKHKDKPEGLGLTETEIEILRLICDENTSKEIADQVCLGRRTIEHYRRRILIKTDSQSPIGLVKFAIKNGLY